MGIIVKQNDERSKLQEKIATELRGKTIITDLDDQQPPDLVDDSEYVRDFEKEPTFKFWLTVFLIILIVAAVAIVFVISRK